MGQVERRGSVRVPARLAMEIKVGSDDSARVESMNVSANGVYFSSSTYIAPLTRLRITLELPLDGGGKPGRFACDGVVVRVEPEEFDAAISAYDIACYFTSISEKDQGALERYVLSNAPF